MSLYRLSVTMLPAIVEGFHTTSAMFTFTAEKADKKSSTEHLNPFSEAFFFCQSVLMMIL